MGAEVVADTSGIRASESGAPLGIVAIFGELFLVCRKLPGGLQVLDGLYVVIFGSDGNGTLNRISGDYQSPV